MLDSKKLYTVTELNEAINEILLQERVSVQGEMSGFRISQDKYIYFDLKDENSIMQCFLFKWQLRVSVENGMEVKVTGRPGLYVKGGRFSFRVETIEPMGEGALLRAFELLKQKLATEGLFAPERKKPLPKFPERIGIVSSEDAAAFTDVVRILKNRWAGLSIFLKPVSVQGTSAPEEIASAVEFFNQRFPVDVLILTRGGGSLEDLQAFNAENVCRAVYASRIPVIVGVGHERDSTLVELAASARASTPSNAAEMAIPDKKEWLERLEYTQGFLYKILTNRVILSQKRLSEGAESMKLHFIELLYQKREKLTDLLRVLSAFDPKRRITDLKTRTLSLLLRLHSGGERILKDKRNTFIHLFRILESYNPQKPLERGYSLSYVKGKLVKSVLQAGQGDILETQLQDGMISSTVFDTKNT